MTLDERIEKAARLFAVSAGRDPDSLGILSSEPTWKLWEPEARTVLRLAFPELFADPPTHKIVPLEPTEAMIDAGMPFAEGETTIDASDGTQRAYRAMIKAAP